MSACVFIWFAIWSIADFADANGFVMVARYFGAGMGVAGAFGIFVSIFSLVIAILAVIGAYNFYKR